LIFGPRWCLHLGPNPFIWGQMWRHRMASVG
jgi:hypothetical protein